MSVWTRMRNYFSNLTTSITDGDWFGGSPEQSVAFTIAIIALSAKMAKADGRVTRDEVRTLRQIFEFNESDEDDIARVFDLAKQDVSGYQVYATRIKNLFADDPSILDHVFESLFILSISDGSFDDAEDDFLENVRKIFGVSEQFFNRLKATYVPDNSDDNPYHVLGLEPGASHDQIRHAYHQIVRDNHPDALRAKGLPDETIQLAENRVRAANEAYEKIGKK